MHTPNITSCPQHTINLSPTTQAEPVPLLNNTTDNAFTGVNMYVDDSGAIKELPVNRRASEFAAVCGVHVQIHGDAFVARFRDDDDEFERLDFGLGELSSSAPWVQVCVNANMYYVNVCKYMLFVMSLVMIGMCCG